MSREKNQKYKIGDIVETRPHARYFAGYFRGIVREVSNSCGVFMYRIEAPECDKGFYAESFAYLNTRLIRKYEPKEYLKNFSKHCYLCHGTMRFTGDADSVDDLLSFRPICDKCGGAGNENQIHLNIEDFGVRP